MSRSRTMRASVLLAAAAITMSACSTHPGSAAVVGSESISDGHLDDVALALCAAQSSSGQTTQQLASRAARQGALDVLISGSLSHQFGASRGVHADQQQVTAALAANQQSIDKLPVADRAVFRRTLQDYAEGQLMLVALGTSALTEAGTQNPTQQQDLAAGTKLRDAWVKKHVHVSVDPRYGRFTGGGLVSDSGSLSVPVSSRAVAGAAQTPATSWVSSLPADQKCS